MMKKDNLILVSIIIPVYNVYEWLDQCLESIIRQTFSDFEVILINDGSTDGSDKKCYEWEQRDNRVRTISKENGGPSLARNCGIQNATGEYLVFIDADDWIEKTYLEKLYQAISVNDAAIAECDIYRFNNNTKEKTYHVCSGIMGREYTLEEHMVYGNTAIWKCMIRKSLFTDYGIEFPDCHGEAKAIYALLLAVSKKIVNIPEALYYYRRFRKDSLTVAPRMNKGDENAIGLKAADSLLQGFTKNLLYEKYENLLQKAVKIGFSDRLAGQFYRMSKMDFLNLAEKYYMYINQKFPQSENYQYITLGGYNLNRILRHMNVLHNPYGRFNFSSIISLMNPIYGVTCNHKNQYREIMVNRDISSAFWDIIEEIQPQYIFIDFIEERFDLFKYKNGFMTKSDAFDEASIALTGYQFVKRTSEECMTLWKVNFKKFIEKIEYKIPKCKIVIIENYLSEKYGTIDRERYYKELEWIRNINDILNHYYCHVLKNYKNITIVQAFNCNYYYTDEKYEYGVIPSHLNEMVNKDIADLIAKTITFEG